MVPVAVEEPIAEVMLTKPAWSPESFRGDGLHRWSLDATDLIREAGMQHVMLHYRGGDSALVADEKEYEADGGYWLGGVWAPTNYAIIKGLERAGYEAFAADASERYLAGMAAVFKQTGTVWENYAPETMAPGNPSKKDFVGWSGCGPIALLIENVLGFRPDGTRKALHWNLRLFEPHGIRQLRFGAVTTDLLYDGKSTVKVHSNAAFDLTINSRLIAIKEGDTVIENVIPENTPSPP